MALLLVILFILFLCSSYSEPYRPYIFAVIGLLVLSAIISGFIKGLKERRVEKARQNVLNAVEKAELATLNYEIVAKKTAVRPTAPGAANQMNEANVKWTVAINELTDSINKYNKTNNS